MVVYDYETKNFKGDFDESEKLIVVDCYTTKCGPCKEIAPKIEALSGKYRNIIFYRVNLDEEKAFNKYEIRSVPTFLFFYKRKLVDRVDGASLSSVKKVLDKY